MNVTGVSATSLKWIQTTTKHHEQESLGVGVRNGAGYLGYCWLGRWGLYGVGLWLGCCLYVSAGSLMQYVIVHCLMDSDQNLTNRRSPHRWKTIASMPVQQLRTTTRSPGIYVKITLNTLLYCYHCYWSPTQRHGV